MAFHLKVCTANGRVKTSAGLVPLSEFVENLKKEGGNITDVVPFVLNPKHDNCHLECPDPTKCRGASNA